MDPRLDALARADRDQLVGLAYVITGSREQAEDVVHEVLARVLSRPAGSVEDLVAYLRKAVVNECRSWQRRLIRGRARDRMLEVESHRRELTGPDLFSHAEVMSALAVLGHRQRIAVVLKYLVDLDDAQIAEHLDCAPATVRSTLSRAMRKLRAELDPRQLGEEVK